MSSFDDNVKRKGAWLVNHCPFRVEGVKEQGRLRGVNGEHWTQGKCS